MRRATDSLDLPPDASRYACTGCPTFPEPGGAACGADVLGAATIAYPVDGVLMPPNLNALEVQFVPPANATATTLYEVDFENASTDVRIETPCVAVPDARGGASKGCGLALSPAEWLEVSNKNRNNEAVVVTVRATTDGSCVSSAKTVSLAFSADPIFGGLYFSQSVPFAGVSHATSGVYVHDFMSPDSAAIPFYVPGAAGTCVGCHTISKDGLRATLATGAPSGKDGFGDTRDGGVGLRVNVVDIGERAVVGGASLSPGFQAFTGNHQEIIASAFTTQQNAGFDVLTGNGALIATSSLGGLLGTQPDVAPNNSAIVYVVPQQNTISAIGDHHFMGGSLFTSSFDPSTGSLGPPSVLLHSPNTKLDDAGNGGRSYYYPSFSSDGLFLMFDEAEGGDAFFNPRARVKLLHYPPASGAVPLDLPALNGGEANANVSNSFPRWSLSTQQRRGLTIAWVTFTSTRDYGLRLTGNPALPNCYPPDSPGYSEPQYGAPGGGDDACARPQIWMAAVIVDPDGSFDMPDRSYPALWLPYQNVETRNYSAQWAVRIPTVLASAGDGGSCGGQGASCGSTLPICCADTICCGGTCATTCVR